jgi:conjugal transfer pilus assembly protein TraF
MRLAFALLGLLFAIGVCRAEDDDACLSGDTRPDQGWFFYEKCPGPKKPKPKEPEPAPDVVVKPEPAQPEKRPMTAAWMRKMLPILHERAIDDPTRENVAAYAYLVRALGDKAQRYTEVHMELIKSDPFLDMNNNMPFNVANRNEVLEQAGEEKRKALFMVAEKTAGLFVFFDSKCAFCKPQIASVNRVAKRYKFEVMFISVDGKGLPGATGWVPDNGHAKMLGIKRFPTTILAVPPKTYIPVSFGLMADDQLESGILSAAKAADLIPSEMLHNMNPFDRGVLTLDDMKDGAYDDPDKFVEYVKGKLDQRY